MYGLDDFIAKIVIGIPYLIAIGWIAKIQHRSVFLWLVLGLFIPGVSLLYLSYLLSQHTVKCPQCGRLLQVSHHLVEE